MSASVRIFGIRHHGPGSARSLRAALASWQPDAVLLEGPPEADDILPLAAREGMTPPVAILVYVPDEPQRAVFYPFAAFSPEWVAIDHALSRGVAIRFMDLPQSHAMALEAPAPLAPPNLDVPASSESAAPPEVELWQDPLGRLAQIAGFDDGERWWDHLVESRRDASGAVFDAINDAMAVLREDQATAPPPHDAHREQLREAHMRKTIRAAMADGHERIAVVCGAWHAPALLDPGRKGLAGADSALLKGLAKVRTAVAWTPWSYDRLSFRSGYGAGVASPAYYDLLWKHERHVGAHWLTRAARLLRKQDLDASSAHIIDAVRLAETLAAFRGIPQPGLAELAAAAHAVLCGGQEAPLELIRRKLIIGDRLGTVPDDAPATPLQQDLAALQKRLRMPATADEKDYDLDLRKPNELQRSHLLHRLRLLRVPWGRTRDQYGKKGTFHELWSVAWKPEFIVEVIGAGRWGNTVAAAAGAYAAHRAGEEKHLTELVELLDEVLLADLPAAVEALLGAVQQHAAVGSDVPQLMEALPPLARVSRYGNVRQTDVKVVLDVVDGLVARICVGLPAAAASLDDEAAKAMSTRMSGVADAVGLLQQEDHIALWHATLRQLADQAGLHALVAGRCVRMLHDAGVLPAEELARRLSLALSLANDPGPAAQWIEGFLWGSGSLLIHDQSIWSAIDAWLSGLSADHFTMVLPLLRRTFCSFHPAERRQMGERVKRESPGSAAAVQPVDEFDEQAADAVLPLLAKILGVELRS
jgi:hypothetical protein